MSEQPPNFTLERDRWRRLALVWPDGRRTPDVEPVRAFPISAPRGFVSICDADGHVLTQVEELDRLPAEVREVLESELSLREFVPVVLRIESISTESDPSRWSVETDRGATTFLMEDSDTDVRRLNAHSILLLDTHGIRYLIPDTRKLDVTSHRLLDRYL